jgi:hypothetical protein
MRLVSPLKREDIRDIQFVQRISADVQALAAGL